MESQILISSKEFCLANMISCTHQMVFVSYNRICLIWDNFHDYYFFNPLYCTSTQILATINNSTHTKINVTQYFNSGNLSPYIILHLQPAALHPVVPCV